MTSARPGAGRDAVGGAGGGPRGGGGRDPGEEPGAPGPRRAAAMARSSYLAATLLLSGAAAAVAVAAGVAGAKPVATGVGAAWAIQAIAFWKLVGALYSGRAVLRAWVAGMGARAGGLVLAFLAGGWTPLAARELVLSYGLAMVALLLLEAAWLAARRPPGAPAGTGGGDRGAPPGGGGGGIAPLRSAIRMGRASERHMPAWDRAR